MLCDTVRGSVHDIGELRKISGHMHGGHGRVQAMLFYAKLRRVEVSVRWLIVGGVASAERRSTTWLDSKRR
jgi:hypothetical protein